jgi:hypothetical protein
MRVYANIDVSARELAERDAAIADGLIELLGDALDPFGRRAEGGCDRGLSGLVAIGRQHAGVLQRGEFFLQPLHPMSRFGKLVGDRERRHYRQPRVADLTEFAAQPADAHVEIAREFDEMALLAILASHPELPAIDGDVDLSHFA